MRGREGGREGERERVCASECKGDGDMLAKFVPSRGAFKFCGLCIMIMVSNLLCPLYIF